MSFKPAIFLGGPHAQTLWPKIFRRHPKLPVTLEVLDTPDGDVVEVDFLPHLPGKPGVLVLHGLESRSRTRHVRSLLARVHELGWNGAALNFRWCGKAQHKKPATWRSGDPYDVAFVISVLERRWPGSPLAAAGFSLGGSLILRWLGELGESAPLVGAVAISPAYDFGACAKAIDGPGFWPAFYRNRLLKTLKRKALLTAERFPGIVEGERIRRIETIREYDELVTARMNGVGSAEEYWARVAVTPVVGGIKVPVLLIHAEDDPFVPAGSIPREAIAANPALTFVMHPKGGHMAFVAGTPFKPVYVAEKAAMQFLCASFAPHGSPRRSPEAVPGEDGAGIGGPLPNRSGGSAEQ